MQSAVRIDPAAVGTRPELEPAAVFEVLANRGCRAVLGAVGTEPLTAGEIASRVDAPMSSIYRHLDALTGIGFLEESVRINPHGRNQNQYTRTLSEFCVSLGEDFAISPF